MRKTHTLERTQRKFASKAWNRRKMWGMDYWTSNFYSTEDDDKYLVFLKLGKMAWSILRSWKKSLTHSYCCSDWVVVVGKKFVEPVLLLLLSSVVDCCCCCSPRWAESDLDRWRWRRCSGWASRPTSRPRGLCFAGCCCWQPDRTRLELSPNRSGLQIKRHY